MQTIDMDFDRCYRAVESRDPRFDGWFIVGVRTTGIYCRPSCPTPVRPKPSNVVFYKSAAAAQLAGFRACKRCRPDAIPGSPEWDTRADLAGRAMRLIADGVVDREGVAGLARRLAVSERHLHRTLVEAVGAPPLAVARSQRAQTARVLIETTDLPFAEIAFAAGFPSIRQFNETIRQVFAASPSELRRARRRGEAPEPGRLTVRLAVREPFDGEGVLRWLGARAVPGIEEGEDPSEALNARRRSGGRADETPSETLNARRRSGGRADETPSEALNARRRSGGRADESGCYRRTLSLPAGTGTVALEPGRDHVRATFRLGTVADLPAAVARCRRLLDLDADPHAVAAALSGDEALAPLVAARPGLRAPGTVDGAEWAIRAVIGQQVSLGAARTLTARIVAAFGKPLDQPDGGLSHAFPSPGTLAEVGLESVGLTGPRAETLRELARRLADGALSLDPGADRGEVERAMTEIPGIGPWTVGHVALRALGDPDAFPVGDLGLRRAARRLGLPGGPGALVRRAEHWRPWRGYAAYYLWEVTG